MVVAVWAGVVPLAPASARPVGVDAAPDAHGRTLHFQDVGAGVIPRGVVASVVQDRQGLMWVGTGDGVVRFDGHRFRPKERDGVPAAQRNLGWVRAMLPAGDGRVWIGTESRGLAYWDPASGRLRDLPDRRLDAVGQPQIAALAEDTDGSIWVGTLGGGLERVPPAADRAEVFRHAPGVPGALPDDRVLSLLVAPDGGLWLGTGSGLVRRAPGGAFQPVGMAGLAVTALRRSADGTLWAGTQQGALWRLDASGLRPVAPPGAGRGAIHALLKATAGQLWVGRADGIDVIDTAEGRLLRHVRHDARVPGGLGGSEVTSLWLDRDGWVWVGSLGGGLQRHDPQAQALWVRGADADPSSPLYRPNARSLLTDHHGRLWMGTQDAGIALLDSALRPLQRVDLQPGAGTQPRVQGLAQTADGSVWVAADGVLLQFDPGADAKAPPRLRRRVAGGPAGVFRTVATADGDLWLCGFDGLYRLRPGDASPRRLLLVDDRPFLAEVPVAATGPDGDLWVGTALGLFRVPAGSDRLHPVPSDPELGLAHPVVAGLLWDRAGTLWLDAAVAGLHRLVSWDGRTARFDRVSERHGVLGRPFGVNLAADAQGRIWTHLHIYDPALDRLDVLTAADGQHLGTGWFHSHAVLSDGRLLFGGARGLLVVEPWRYVPVEKHPALVLSDLRVEDVSRPWPAGALVLQPGQQRFSVEFAALEYSEPARIRYAWRLQGVDRDWIEGDADRRAATYAHLPPGRYTLQARASNRAGVWSDEVLTLPVQVLPAWWQHGATRAAGAVLLLLAVLALMQWRTGALRRRKAALQQEVRDRTEQLRVKTELLERESAALREASLTDPLTGLRNRRHLLQHIGADVAVTLRRWDDHLRRGAPHGAAPPADADLLFFIVDVDHFKRVNDLHGHAAGDAVLRQFRARLASVFRDTDHLVRWGGEEFLVVARGSDRNHATGLAERARRAVADAAFMLDDGQALHCSCSIGFAALPLSTAQPRALGWEDTVGLADAALYAVKARRRNGWAGVIDAVGHDATTLARLKADGWAEALARGQLPLQASGDAGDAGSARA